jgi:hypothetical protein
MSDLRTEIFTKVLPKMHSLTKPTDLNNLNFDDPDQPLVAEPIKLTNNERIFDWIKDHPACYGSAVARAFNGDIIESSVISQLYTLEKRGLLHKAKCSTTGKYMYSTAVDAYPRAVKADVVAKMHEARAKIGKEEMARRISEGHAANRLAEAETKLEPIKKKIVLRRKVTGEQVSPPAVQVTPVDLNTLSIVQARKLYDELKQIFGA